MRGHTVFWLAALAGSLAGCNQPAVSLKPPVFQSSENTVHDWHDVAIAVSHEIQARGLLAPDRPLFIREQAPDSAFIHYVADALESDILTQGGTIARSPAGATVVNLDVDFVRWGPRDKPPGLLGTAAGLATLPGILTGASYPMSTWAAADAAAFTAIGVGGLVDLAIATTPTMNAEAIWKATILAGDRVIMKVQKPIYIRADDIPLYAKTTSLGPVGSDGSGAVLHTRTVRYAE
ncbi:MAG TPA: hypothetical protein DDZ81_12815 [Acetobacteraceae bacterium]|jgi:hypothetical protein|nr:hypothetical protein [Acetobacteraceae bacterium]